MEKHLPLLPVLLSHTTAYTLVLCTVKHQAEEQRELPQNLKAPSKSKSSFWKMAMWLQGTLPELQSPDARDAVPLTRSLHEQGNNPNLPSLPKPVSAHPFRTVLAETWTRSSEPPAVICGQPAVAGLCADFVPAPRASSLLYLQKITSPASLHPDTPQKALQLSGNKFCLALIVPPCAGALHQQGANGAQRAQQGRQKALGASPGARRAFGNASTAEH